MLWPVQRGIGPCTGPPPKRYLPATYLAGGNLFIRISNIAEIQIFLRFVVPRIKVPHRQITTKTRMTTEETTFSQNQITTKTLKMAMSRFLACYNTFHSNNFDNLPVLALTRGFKIDLSAKCMDVKIKTWITSRLIMESLSHCLALFVIHLNPWEFQTGHFRPRNLKELCSEGPGLYSHWR